MNRHKSTWRQKKRDRRARVEEDYFHVHHTYYCRWQNKKFSIDFPHSTPNSSYTRQIRRENFSLTHQFSLLLVSVFLSSRNHPHIMFGFFFVQLINLEIFSSFLPRYRSLIRRSSRKTKQQIANAGTNVDDCSIQ